MFPIILLIILVILVMLVILPFIDEFKKIIPSVNYMGELKKTKPSVINQIYKILSILDKILTQNNIEYWIDGGTLLGAIRHKGIIPWDDDGDLEIWDRDETKLLNLKNVFANHGLVLMPVFYGFKVFFRGAQRIPNFKWKYPAIDIFVMKKGADYIDYKYERAQKAFEKCRFKIDDLYPLERYPFGSLMLSGGSSKNIKNYLDRCYGADWATHAYLQYDHQNEKVVFSKKVKLI